MTQTIIFNNDGSIKYKNLAGFVTQGSNNVDLLAVAIDGYTSDEYTASFYFTLPDGDVVALEGTAGTVEGQSGYTVLLTSAVTSIAGNDKVSVRLLDTNDDVLFTYPFTLVINPTSATPDTTLISYSQYSALVSSLSSFQPKFSTTNVRAYASVSGAMEDLTNLAIGQVFYVFDKKAWAYKQDAEHIAVIPYALPVDYSTLSYMATNGLLIQGAQYRLTDYVATTSSEDTESANHPFDLILVADSATTLNENARAVIHNGDSYFSSCDLGAWEIKYSLYNDDDRFAWADDDGKGVIYYLKDEWGNSAFYDFKGILFTKEDDYDSAYTFNYYDSGNKDASIDPSKHCINNKIGQLNIKASDCVYSLPFIVFVDGSDCYGNEFDCDCQQITIDSACPSNRFGRYCRNIVISSTSSNNSFGVDCHDIELGTNCHNNRFANSCHHIEFGESCTANTFGNSCSYIQFGDEANYNTFGNRCTNISFSNALETMIDYVHYCRFGDDCHFIKLFSDYDLGASVSNQIQYLSVPSSTTGWSSALRQSIILPRNLPFEVKFTCDYYTGQSHFSTDFQAATYSGNSSRALDENEEHDALVLQLISIGCFENIIITDGNMNKLQFAGCKYNDGSIAEAYYQTALYIDTSRPAYDCTYVYLDDGAWYVGEAEHYNL